MQKTEELYIVVGGETGARYRHALARSNCIGIDRHAGRHGVEWDDKQVLHVNLCRSCDENLHRALRRFMDARPLPKRITVIYAAGRLSERGQGTDRRRAMEVASFDALALKNIVTAVREIVEERAAKEQRPTALHVAAVAGASAKPTMEGFLSKFTENKCCPFVQRGALVLRAELPPKDLVAATLPHILSMPAGESRVLDIAAPRAKKPAAPAPDIKPWLGIIRRAKMAPAEWRR